MRGRVRVVLLLLALPCLALPPAAGAAPKAAKGSKAPRSEPKPAAAPPVQWKHPWADGGVVYEVFVRSFLDSNGDGVGDLAGLMAKLDYLNDGDPKTTTDLGVDALWLMPIFKSTSYHGYDITDYEAVRGEYGSNADLEQLCREAHKRGMRVILDLVLNHTSEGHRWFYQSASSRTSPKRDWYVWRDKDPEWRQPWLQGSGWYKRNGAYYFGVFGSGLPDLNYLNPEVVKEAKRIAKLWLDAGVDGFRLDAARFIVEGPEGEADTAETHAFWKDFSAYVRSVRPDAVLIGEVWATTMKVGTYFGDTSVVAGGDEIPNNVDFALSEAIVSSVKDGHAVNVFSVLRETQKYYPKGAALTPFITNHDNSRVATVFGGDVRRLRTAAAILLTLPGLPVVYYGEEIGLQNYGDEFGTFTPQGKDDEGKRTPMLWDGSENGGFTTGKPWTELSSRGDVVNVASESKDPKSVLSRYRDLIALRHGSEALLHGELEQIRPQGAILAYFRKAPGETLLVVHNVGEARAKAGPFKLEGTLTPILTDDGVQAPVQGPDGWTSDLPPFSSAVWKLTPAKTP